MSSNDLWPEIDISNRPWTRWWWMGCAVDKATITRLLECYRDAGLGGVEITSIYGVDEDRHPKIEYLSEKWIEMIEHAISVADSLGMGVDLPPGSGWRIGGDFISDEIAAASLKIVAGDETTEASFGIVPNGEKIKRAGPGGDGRSFNPYSPKAIQAAIGHFDPSFKTLNIRSQFHDSWEYQSSGCPELFETFAALNGYDMRECVGHFTENADQSVAAQIKYDLQCTLEEMALKNFIMPWSDWCHRLGQLSRNQAHGTPGNWLDFYGAVDIPETEVFKNMSPDTPLLSKIASSAAHVTGKPITSSETGTWKNEHFHVSLGETKTLLDNLFVSGINHHVYHGTAYSPDDVSWPGWLFYASTQFNPQNSIWRDFPTLNAYATRCQSVLQDGEPDADVLVYFPIHDVHHNPDRDFGEIMGIEGPWLKNLGAADTFRTLWNRGYEFDYISDRQLETVEVNSGAIASPGGSYKALVIPTCMYIPLPTLERIVKLAELGANVVFLTPTPADLPGRRYGGHDRILFNKLMKKVNVSDDIDATLQAYGVHREPMADLNGLLFIRRRIGEERYYFIANEGNDRIDTWIPITTSHSSVINMDPMTGRVGASQTRANNEVRLQLPPGNSLILKTSRTETKIAPWRYDRNDSLPFEIRGTWDVRFISGGPVLPAGFSCNDLASWTDQGSESERFAGTALYHIEFDAPESNIAWTLDLGVVHSSARVRLNDIDMGTLIGPTFAVYVEQIRPVRNVLEIEVTNLSANRIRDLDRRGTEWKVFLDINIVSRNGKPLDASQWPVEPSGLIGPVTLRPVS